MYIGVSTPLTCGGAHLALRPPHVRGIDTPMYINNVYQSQPKLKYLVS